MDYAPDYNDDVKDARNAEALNLLRTDPEKYFRETRRRQPFGFAAQDDDQDYELR